MSYSFIEGVGIVAIDSNKNAEQKAATIEYYTNTAPKYEELNGFFGGFNDTKSMIYRWGQKLSGSANEEKNRWFGEQVKQWGEAVGYYDSIALAKYHEDMEKTRPLNALEQADKEANNAIMKQFELDMYDAYDNKSGDISDVQQRYGYTPEDLGTLSSLWEFAKMAVNEPSYTLGTVSGMILKDPELLLLQLLRVPGSTAAGMTKVNNAVNRAIGIQPTYTKSFVNMVGAQRTKAAVGRGIEGSMYGGVYEALHDLTFNGHIKEENVERGIAFGALLGTGFGAISKNTGKSWLRDKTESSQALKNITLMQRTFGQLKLIKDKSGQNVLTWQTPKGRRQDWKIELDRIKNDRKITGSANAKPKQKPTGKPTEEPIIDPEINPEFRSPTTTPKEIILPTGLDNLSRASRWKERAVDLIEERVKKSAKKSGDTPLTREQITDGVVLRAKGQKEILKRKKEKYTKDEIEGLAFKEIAKIEEAKLSVAQRKKQKLRPTKQNEWGSNREKNWGKEAVDNNEVVRDSSGFDYIFEAKMKDLKPVTTKQFIKAGAIGAGVGYFIADEDKTLGGLMGLVGGLLFRGKVKGINLAQAKLKARVYNVADKSIGIQKSLEIQAGKTLNVLHRVLKGKDSSLSELDFLSYIEDYSKPASKSKFGRIGRETNLNKEQRLAVDAYRDLMIKFERAAKEVGVLEDGQFVQDYVTHIFRNKKINADRYKKFRIAMGKKGSKLDDQSTYADIRKLVGNIKELSKEFPDLETDVFAILDAYSRSMSKAIAGKNITKVLENTAVMDGTDAFSVIMSMTEKGADYARTKMGYQVSNHPALRNKLVHPLVKNAIDDFYAPEIGSEGLLNKILVVNNAMKRLAVSFSLFHAQALVLSGIYSGVGTAYFTKAGKARMAKVRQIMDGQYDYHTDGMGAKEIGNVTGRQTKGDFVHGEVLREIAQEGVEVGVKANEFVDAGYNTVRSLLEKYAPPVAKVQAGIDKITWDIAHDRLKVFTYLTMKERLMSSQPKGIARLGDWKPLSEVDAKRVAAEFTNDAYGGQRHSKLAVAWQKKAIENADNPKGNLYNLFALWTTPSKAKLSNLVLFSPDWTISNLRIGFRGLGMTKDLVGKIAKGKKLTPVEMGEWNLYMGYMARAFVSTSLLAWMAQNVMQGLGFGDEDTELDLKDFWLTGRLDIGNGEEMVVSKQIAEPMHWLTNPMQTGLNKTSTMPKIAMELFLGKEYVSVKHGTDDRTFLAGGTVTGPTLERGSPKDMMGWMFGKVTPISLSQLSYAYRKDEDMGYAVKKSMFGSIGYPIYGTRENTGD